MIQKILLFGASGMLGRYIYTYFLKYTNIEIIKIDYKIVNIEMVDLENILIKNGINDETCIINCIGSIPQRNKNNKRMYYIVNSIFPHMLWNICKKYDSKMIQPTTDCVFTGLKGNYVETDEHDENGDYGLSKSLGEPIECTVIRTSIIGKEIQNKKSFMEWVISSVENNQKNNGWTNHYWNGITCLEYSKFIEHIINNNLFWTGIRHIHSPTSKSKYEMACIIIKTFFDGVTEKNIDDIILGKEDINNIDKTLKSNYTQLYKIPELEIQINELTHFELNSI